jgi:glycosyltransferase involved in cell wall biosynthesis
MFSPGRGDGPALEAVVRSAALLKDGVVVILGNVGSRPEWAYLRRLAAEPPYAGRVFILPPVPPDTLLILTSGARVGLIPMRLTGLMRLALPNKLFEYAAAGIPVITPDLPVIRPIVERFGYGMFCDFATPTAVAAAITAVLADGDRYAAMQAGARAAAAVYNWETQEAVLLDLYRRVLNR